MTDPTPFAPMPLAPCCRSCSVNPHTPRKTALKEPCSPELSPCADAWRWHHAQANAEPINLDDHTTSPDELERLIPDLNPQQAAYATIKARAMRARLQGSIPAAQRLEQRLEALYLDIPPALRW
jgi:hypothetical protein